MESGILTQFIFPARFLWLLKQLGTHFFREGIYYYKLLEYTIVASEISGENIKILDIGSGKSFLPFFSLRKKWETWLVDNGEFYPDFHEFYIQLTKNKFPQAIDRLKILKGDFLEVDLPLNYFDFITALSTLEHFPGVGDIKAMEKIKLLLKNGGTCIVTLPYSPDGTKERIMNKNGFTFFQRDYEINCIFNRIIEPSGLNLKYFYIIGERNPDWGKKFFFQKPLNKFKNLWSLFPFLFWEIYYRGKSRNLPLFKYPGIIILVLKK